MTGNRKPNADIESVTSPLHHKTENVTKKDLVFYGGTKDISRNETSKGLDSVKGFAQGTANANVILPGAPHRYDLPPSCVNTEVNLYNKRLQSFMSTFNHVKVLSMSTERQQHTNHGLHLNKKGKDWIANNLHVVKEIRNLNLPGKISPPIVLPWRDVNENVSQLAEPNKGRYWSRSDLKEDFGNQVLTVTVNDGTECLSPSCRNDEC